MNGDMIFIISVQMSWYIFDESFEIFKIFKIPKFFFKNDFLFWYGVRDGWNGVGLYI